MAPRFAKYLYVVAILASACRADFVYAQRGPPALHLHSIEWLVASNEVVVRGVIVDITPDKGNWNIVTLDVRETLKGGKGEKAERVRFAAHKLESADAALAEAKKSKCELVWILKRQDAGVPGEAPDRQKAMARHKVELHAPFLPGRPDAPALPMIPVGQPESDAMKAPSFLTVDLRLLKTSEELVKAIRAAIAEPAPSAGSYTVALPMDIARKTGFAHMENYLTVPLDHRLEACARRLVLTPEEFLHKLNNPNHVRELRLEGVKALRRFKSETNMSIIRTWLDDPMSVQAYKDNQKTPLADLVPAAPKNQQAGRKVSLPKNLADVPEITFQTPLTKKMTTGDAQLHTACTIENVQMLNQTKTDAFIESLMKKRPDLAGLSFAMGDACRMRPEASKQFVAALDVFRKVESAPPVPIPPPPPPIGTGTDEKKDAVPPPPMGTSTDEKKKPARPKGLVHRYQEESTKREIAPSAHVAALMQVLGHDEANNRLDLVEYLAGIKDVDSTKALAKLAVFSEESDIRTAAVNALKTRSAKDYTDVLLAGLNYPWPAVAERSSDAIAKLGRKDLLPHLIGVLESPDPRAPQVKETDGKKTTVVRELVRLNHHHNCLLCHAPANTTNEKDAKLLEGLTAQVPVPSESMVAYYRPSDPNILVRFDVTYLRQDFSVKLKVADADPWPEMQRYDYLVRTRAVTEEEARAYQELLRPSEPNVASPYHRAALSALRQITGRDTEPNAKAWRKLTGL